MSDRELSIKVELLTCKHFRGTFHHETCLANVNFRQLVGGDDLGWVMRLPCGPPLMNGKMGAPVVCDKRETWTMAEAAARVDAQELAVANNMRAFRIAHDDAKAKGFKRGHGGQSSVGCPVCATGVIRYSVASFNGHMHAACETKGCFRWME